jgi:YidC/Oxa1 family membrane protein insertase
MLLVTANIFQPLIDVFEAVLKFFHNSVGIPWGWSIVLLTICVRAILVPLTVRQIRSMARMQALAPEMKAIQAKYKEDKQRQQQEMMKFYKENNVNPLSSCLPLAAQLPVFISLYYMLRQSLRVDICPAFQRAQNHGILSSAHTVACGSHGQSGFLFIGDITNKATGATLVVLIILYVGTQLGSSLMMSGAMTDRTQRQIMLFMPLLFVIFVIRFPAGVLVYWVTTNLWTISQQYVVKRRIGPVRPATPGGSPPAGGGSGGGGPPKSGPNGSGGSGGGLAGLIRKPKEPEAAKQPVATGARGAAPPKPPRKKKKRSGRRR